MEELKEKCGIVGIYGKDLDVARYAFFSLFALQHRGQEASGITTSDGKDFYTHKGAGLVSQVYTDESIKLLNGHIGIGHNRYSTSAGGALAHAQPVINKKNNFALAHNGNLPSVKALENFLQGKGVLEKDRSDSELISDAIDYFLEQGEPLKDAVKEVYPLLTGAFSLIMMTKDTLLAVKDACGMRPLCLGRLGDGYIIASETCALKTIGAEIVREIEGGEMLVINEQGLEEFKLANEKPSRDIFEYVYFARPDSIIGGKLIYDVRKNFGKNLAKEFKLEADIVVPVPDTAVPVAIGFSHASKIPMEMALVKNRYVHRTFIEPDQASRRKSVALKLVPLPETIEGKRVVLIDDSIVRGNTCRKLIKTLFDVGAKEVHMLVSSPPVRYPDFYGIDTPKQEELIASSNTVEQIREYLGATSLHYLSLSGLIDSIGIPEENLCTSFFTGKYPINLHERISEVNYDVPNE